MALNLTIPLSNYKSNGENVPEGRYSVVIDDLEMTESKTKKPMLNVWFRIVSGEYEDSVLKDRFVLQDTALFRIVMLMQALGMKTPKKDLRIPAERFMGKRLEIDVKDGEPYKGRVKSEVVDYMKAAAPAATAAAGDDLDDDADEADEADEDSGTTAEAKSAPQADVADEAGDADDLDDLEDLEV